MITPPLVLASASPRRRELLADIGLPFETVSPRVVESVTGALSARELTLFNAARKACAVARIRADGVVLGADTLVALDGEILGKPDNLEHAFAMLRRLAGREHQVFTGVHLAADGGRRTRSFCVVSDVKFRRLSDAQIHDYMAKIDPLDKAGAYAAQGHGREIISDIGGSYTNVVGLPMDETLAALAEFGIKPTATPS